MAIFPSSVVPAFGYTITPQFITERVGPSGSDFVQRRRKRIAPLHVIEMSFAFKNSSDEKAIHDFFVNRAGGWDAFSFYDYRERSWSSVYLGLAASTAAINLKCKNASSLTLYRNGSVISTSEYAYTATSASNDQDQISLTSSATSATATLTASYTGTRHYLCVFADDGLQREEYDAGAYRTTIRLFEVSS